MSISDEQREAIRRAFEKSESFTQSEWAARAIEAQVAGEVMAADKPPSFFTMAKCAATLRFSRDPMKVAKARGTFLGIAWRLHKHIAEKGHKPDEIP